MPRRIVLILLLAFSSVGVGWVSYGASVVYKAWSSTHWPTSKGLIVSSEVIKVYQGDSGKYEPKIRYTYTVNGVNYSSNRIRFGDMASASEKKAKSFIDRYSKGAAVRVYYESSNPSIAVLEAGIFFNSFFHLLLGVAFLGMGVFWFLIYRKVKRADQE